MISGQSSSNGQGTVSMSHYFRVVCSARVAITQRSCPLSPIVVQYVNNWLRLPGEPCAGYHIFATGLHRSSAGQETRMIC